MAEWEVKSRLPCVLRAFPIPRPGALRTAAAEALGRPFFKEKTGDFSSKFQYFVVEEPYWNAPVKALSADERRWTRSGTAFCPCDSAQFAFAIFGRIIQDYQPFVNSTSRRIVLDNRAAEENTCIGW